MMQAFDEIDQRPQPPPQPIEFPHNQTVALAQMRQGCRQPWPIIPRAACFVLEYPLAPGFGECVVLQIEALIVG
jgi:hypothetical protein